MLRSVEPGRRGLLCRGHIQNWLRPAIGYNGDAIPERAHGRFSAAPSKFCGQGDEVESQLIQITKNYSMSVVSRGIAPIVGRMRAGEADDLNRLFTRTLEALPYYNETAKRSEAAKYSAKLLRESTENDPDSVLVARIDDQIVGFCFSKGDDGLVWLAWFGVHPSFRRQGIGSQLLLKLDETVRSGRSHKIWCDCRTENEASKVALRRHGYVELCTVRNHWYGQDFILWEKLVA